MTPSITIQDTCPFHLREMAIAMQEDSAETAYKMGMTPLKALWYSYRKSIICRSVFIEGKIAAIFGLSGSVFSDTGEPWLILAPTVEDYPFKTAFIYKKELQKMNAIFPLLQEWVPEDNEKSIRLLTLMGFKVSKNRVQVGDATFRLAERRTA